MKSLIEVLLPRIWDTERWAWGFNVFIRVFEGKNHLRKELSRKAEVYARFHEPIMLIVLIDQDASDCRVLKQQLIEKIEAGGLSNFKVCIVCKDLECCYLGDMAALREIQPHSIAPNLSQKAKYRNPEKLNGKDELKKLLATYQPISFAGAIAPRLNLKENRCGSFTHAIRIFREIFSPSTAS